ncbi:uncharacterized protein MELLADRAFT_115262 [Melampsora larici-populina 98AG31]|uniref:Putative tyrosine-protein phosphatase OCA1 n=1 Tax=Melampsora larici-populina (strain 98AG31 / pathotype 3-4-7) TaxID=747676 RepID=F4R8C1_MELLP|nr:uncharacterized protein MELLADRAFT_115262 [Melampsora larici-populina 98AG31]EGG11463.1 hypothetical protein MELLADRAFT_115262 [Melampsora larici-populina 98AG31]
MKKEEAHLKTPIRPKLSPTNLTVSSPDIKSTISSSSSITSISSSTSIQSQSNHQLNRSHPITLINQSISPPHSSKLSNSQTDPTNPFNQTQHSTPKPSNHQQASNPSSFHHPSSSSSTSSNPNLFDPLPSLPSRLRKASLKWIPPPNFGFIESWLYRSGEPNELSHQFLLSLNLKSLIWLAPRPISSSFRECLSSTVKFYDLGILHAAAIDEVTDEAVTEALRLILSPKLYPLMIMCAGGSHRTGTVIGCLRKLQGWNLASIFEEYRRYAGAQHHIMNEQFIEFYDTRRLTQNLSQETMKSSRNETHSNEKVMIRVERNHEGIDLESLGLGNQVGMDHQLFKRATPADEMGCRAYTLN